MLKKEEHSTQSRMSFYSELSHLRRSAITKYSENENQAELKDSYRIYVVGLPSSHKQQLMRCNPPYSGLSIAPCRTNRAHCSTRNRSRG